MNTGTEQFPALRASRPADPAVDIAALQFAWPGQAPLLSLPALQLARGERLFLAGPSGSGKSTLLNIVAGVLGGYRGRVQVLGAELAALSGRDRDRLRADRIGVVFQQFNLLPYLDPLANIALPCRVSAARRARAQAHSGSVEAAAQTLMDELGLEHTLLRRDVHRLSIGQQQRVAVARALIGNPELVIADEPTSALDADNQVRFMQQLLRVCERRAAAVLFVSHDRALRADFDRHLDLAQLNATAPDALA